jgi:hypothetical protein
VFSVCDPQGASSKDKTIWQACEEEVLPLSLPVACNLHAIPDADRPRYRALVKQLRSAIQREQDLPDGFVYRVNTTTLSLPELAEWITLERLCCPFLHFRLDLASGEEPQLQLTGPAETKAILLQEFPG